jgi:hypothetical protein
MAMPVGSHPTAIELLIIATKVDPYDLSAFEIALHVARAVLCQRWHGDNLFFHAEIGEQLNSLFLFAPLIKRVTASLRAAGDIHGAMDRLYEDVLAYESAFGVRFEWVLHVGDFGVWPDRTASTRRPRSTTVLATSPPGSRSAAQPHNKPLPSLAIRHRVARPDQLLAPRRKDAQKALGTTGAVGGNKLLHRLVCTLELLLWHGLPPDAPAFAGRTTAPIGKRADER